MPFTLRSPAFEPGQAVPRRYTCDADDLSPPLAWSGAPSATRAYAILLDDPDAPSGTFTHWLVADIPATRTGLAEAEVPGGDATAGANDFGRVGYGGPCPPRGHGAHRYQFHLYALSQPLTLAAGFSRRALEQAMRGHVLGTAVLKGTYERGG